MTGERLEKMQNVRELWLPLSSNSLSAKHHAILQLPQRHRMLIWCFYNQVLGFRLKAHPQDQEHKL